MSLLQANEILGVIGCGTMGEAIVRGLIRSASLTPAQIVVSDARQEVARDLAAKYGVRAEADNLAVATTSDVALLCVKPYQLAQVLDSDATRSALAGKLVISIAAGVRLDRICGFLPKSAVIRAMPNTAVLVGEGMAGLARSKAVTDEHMALALGLFASVGKSQEVDEAMMDVVTALAGSGPAFVYMMIEAMADGAVRLGLRKDVALAMASQVVQGAARMCSQTGTHPSVLKDQVSTPGGCTVAGLAVMEEGKVRAVLSNTIVETTRVATKLGT